MRCTAPRTLWAHVGMETGRCCSPGEGVRAAGTPPFALPPGGSGEGRFPTVLCG